MGVVLGVTGGIAAIKAPSIASAFMKRGYSVKVILTENAKHFLGDHSFDMLDQDAVYHSMWESHTIDHIRLAQSCEVLVIAPATANTIAKIAHGIADNLLTTMVLALRSSRYKFACPAMNSNMYQNPIVQENLKKMRLDLDWVIIEPATGKMACGDEGKGILPPTRTIVETVYKHTRHLNLTGTPGDLK